MKIIFTTILLSISAIASSVHYYEDFASKILDVKESGKGLSLTVSGTVAHCGGFFPLSFRFNSEIQECSDSVINLKLTYLRKEPCDQAMHFDKKKFKVRVPRNCDFKLREGSLIEIVSNGQNLEYTVF